MPYSIKLRQIMPVFTIISAFSFSEALEAMEMEHGVPHCYYNGEMNLETGQIQTDTKPVLTVGDFDGDGIVTQKDVDKISQFVKSKKNVAFYDRNADGVVDQKDVEVTKSELGQSSILLDQQLAELFKAVQPYFNQKKAIAAGYRPFTQPLEGHGTHWAKLPTAGADNVIDYTHKRNNPEGLNYNGKELWGVFYYLGPSPYGQAPFNPAFQPKNLPESVLFAPDKDGHRAPWHHHTGATFVGLDYNNPPKTSDDVKFYQGYNPYEAIWLAAQWSYTTGNPFAFRWVPRFHMRHIWSWGPLNPCGTFAGHHQLIAQDEPNESTISKNGGGALCHGHYSFGQVSDINEVGKPLPDGSIYSSVLFPLTDAYDPEYWDYIANGGQAGCMMH